MKKLLCLILSCMFLVSHPIAAPAPPEINVPSAVLMERDTGTVLFEKNSHNKMPPASVTKVMTLLLVMEAIDSGKISIEDMVTVSEYASSMGGSQVFLSPGEQMSLHDMLKATVIASGNDSSVALAEHVAGSEESFVALMNTRAKELGMNDTTFKNCTGLDTEGHVTSAYDIALMSRELIKHPKIKEYTTIWMDTLRNGAFQLANTNKLIRSYKGITGLKTGSTSVAKFCLSATAMRDGMELIATILAAPSSNERFANASKLLDFGFANYALYDGAQNIELNTIPVVLGASSNVRLKLGEASSVLTEKNNISNITCETDLPTELKAPVEEGQKVGCVRIKNGETLLSEIPVVAEESVPRLGVAGIFLRIAEKLFIK